ncbi:hypothetical protein EON66_03345 [archaeon]|nr:MAG: hypothetical protein EON66_03345 [archaeon]
MKMQAESAKTVRNRRGRARIGGANSKEEEIHVASTRVTRARVRGDRGGAAGAFKAGTERSVASSGKGVVTGAIETGAPSRDDVDPRILLAMERPNGALLCALCRTKKYKLRTPACILCGLSHQRNRAMKQVAKGEEALNFSWKGRHAKCTDDLVGWVHVACVEWMPYVNFSDATNKDGVCGLGNIDAKQWRAECIFCKRTGFSKVPVDAVANDHNAQLVFPSSRPTGAVIECSARTCSITYHALCARAAGWQMDSNTPSKVVTYCGTHSSDAALREAAAVIVPCQICGRSEQEERTLLCDDCDKPFHMACLRPPLTHAPTGDWFCPTCTVARVTRGLIVPSAALLGGSLLRRSADIAGASGDKSGATGGLHTLGEVADSLAAGGGGLRLPHMGVRAENTQLMTLDEVLMAAAPPSAMAYSDDEDETGHSAWLEGGVQQDGMGAPASMEALAAAIVDKKRRREIAIHRAATLQTVSMADVSRDAERVAGSDVPYDDGAAAQAAAAELSAMQYDLPPCPQLDMDDSATMSAAFLQECFTLLNAQPSSHISHRALLLSHTLKLAPVLSALVHAGHSLLCYGFGSKRDMLRSLAARIAIDVSVVEINGAASDASIGALLATITTALTGEPASEHTSSAAQLRTLRGLFGAQRTACHVAQGKRIPRIAREAASASASRAGAFSSAGRGSGGDSPQLGGSSARRASSADGGGASPSSPGDVGDFDFVSNAAALGGGDFDDGALDAGTLFDDAGDDVGGDAATNVDGAEAIHAAITARPRVLVVVHNWDALLSKDSDAVHVVCALAGTGFCPVLASVDHVQFLSAVDAQAYLAGNWLAVHTPTYVRYATECVARVEEVNVGRRTQVGLQYVLRSLTPNHHQLLRLLLELCRSVGRAAAAAEGDVFDQGTHVALVDDNAATPVAFEALLAECRDAMLLTNDSALRAYLVELVDHQLVTRNGPLVQLRIRPSELTAALATLDDE